MIATEMDKRSVGIGARDAAELLGPAPASLSSLDGAGEPGLAIVGGRNPPAAEWRRRPLRPSDFL